MSQIKLTHIKHKVSFPLPSSSKVIEKSALIKQTRPTATSLWFPSILSSAKVSKQLIFSANLSFLSLKTDLRTLPYAVFTEKTLIPASIFMNAFIPPSFFFIFLLHYSFENPILHYHINMKLYICCFILPLYFSCV